MRGAARVVVIGDRRVYDEGARVAKASRPPDEFVDLKHLDPASIQRGVAAKAGGESALAKAMRMAEPGYDDEILFTSKVLAFKGVATEFNVLEGLWNARVTSHIPLKDVSAALNPHAGDGGNFGREEIEIIEPAVRKARALGC